MTHHTCLRLVSLLASAWLGIACSDTNTSDSGLGVSGGAAPGVPTAAGSGGLRAAAGAAAGASGGGVRTGVAGSSGAYAVSGSGGSAVAGSGGAADGDDAGVNDPVAGSGAAGSGAAGGGAGAAGSSDDGIGGRAPFMATGTPIMAADSQWTWVPFPDTKCRAGMPAGIGVNFSSSSKRLMIYLEGGGACFDAQTCGANPDAVGMQSPGNAGVFNRSRMENPVRDWNYVYVPYCTGDVHMGAKDDGSVEGVTGTQHFNGRTNLNAFLQRIVPTFSDAEQVLLTGVSAGGFGASSNAAFVQWAFGETPVTMIDDSGPTLSNEYLPTCLTSKYATTWGLQDSILDDCGSACSASEDYSVQFLDYTARYAEGRFNGLIESDEDSVIRGFFGIGTNNGADDCMGILLFTPMPAADFLAGLLDYRERVKAYPGFSTFYPSSTQHTWLGGDSFYTAAAGGVQMVDWFRGILEGKPAVHAGH